MLSISNFEGNVAFLNESVSKTLGSSFSNSHLKDYVFASQIIADNGFYHTNFLIKKVTNEDVQNTVSQAFEIQFNTDLATLPQFVTNHNNGRKEIIVQDQENILYLVSNTGKILWKIFLHFAFALGLIIGLQCFSGIKPIARCRNVAQFGILEFA